MLLKQKTKIFSSSETRTNVPTVAARMASTFDRISHGRLLINVVAGGDPVELQGDGLYLDHDERYEAADEF